MAGGLIHFFVTYLDIEFVPQSGGDIDLIDDSDFMLFFFYLCRRLFMLLGIFLDKVNA